MVIVAVIGSRTFRDYENLKNELDKKRIDKIHTGDAVGTDHLAIRYAKEKGIPFQIFLSDWKKHGRKAGIITNDDIIANVNEVIAFWDGESPGTKDTISKVSSTQKLSIIHFKSQLPSEGRKAWLEFDESEEGRLTMFGRATYECKEDIKRLGGRFDGVLKGWYIDYDTKQTMETIKEKIQYLADDKQGENKRKRSETSYEVWEIRKLRKKQKDDFEDKLKHFERTDKFYKMKYCDKFDVHVLICGSIDKCKNYITEFNKKYDYMLYGTKIEEINPNKYYLKRWINTSN